VVADGRQVCNTVGFVGSVMQMFYEELVPCLFAPPSSADEPDRKPFFLIARRCQQLYTKCVLPAARLHPAAGWLAAHTPEALAAQPGARRIRACGRLGARQV
jgi:hypothetical protein